MACIKIQPFCRLTASVSNVNTDLIYSVHKPLTHDCPLPMAEQLCKMQRNFHL